MKQIAKKLLVMIYQNPYPHVFELYKKFHAEFIVNSL